MPLPAILSGAPSTGLLASSADTPARPPGAASPPTAVGGNATAQSAAAHTPAPDHDPVWAAILAASKSQNPTMKTNLVKSTIESAHTKLFFQQYQDLFTYCVRLEESISSGLSPARLQELVAIRRSQPPGFAGFPPPSPFESPSSLLTQRSPSTATADGIPRAARTQTPTGVPVPPLAPAARRSPLLILTFGSCLIVAAAARALKPKTTPRIQP